MAHLSNRYRSRWLLRTVLQRVWCDIVQVVRAAAVQPAAVSLMPTVLHNSPSGSEEGQAVVVMQAQPLPQPHALCHTLCRTVGNKQLQRVFT